MIPWKSKHGWKCKYKLDWVEEVPRSPGDVPKGRGHPPGECADLSRQRFAQHSVMEITDLPILANEIEVQ